MNVAEESAALDDLIEMYTNEVTRNNLSIQSMKQEIERLDARNSVLCNKLNSTFNRIEELRGDKHGPGNIEHAYAC